MKKQNGLTNSCEKKRSKRQRRKRKIYPLEGTVLKNNKERLKKKKAFLSEQGKEIEGNNRWERLEISSRKLEIPREYIM